MKCLLKCMSDEARAARNAYLKKWRRANSDKMRKYRETYWEKKAMGLRKESEAHAAHENDQANR